MTIQSLTAGGKQFAIKYWVLSLVVIVLAAFFCYQGVAVAFSKDTGWVYFLGVSIPMGIAFTSMLVFMLSGEEVLTIIIPPILWRWIVITALSIGVMVGLAAIGALGMVFVGFMQFFT